MIPKIVNEKDVPKKILASLILEFQGIVSIKRIIWHWFLISSYIDRVVEVSNFLSTILGGRAVSYESTDRGSVFAHKQENVIKEWKMEKSNQIDQFVQLEACHDLCTETKGCKSVMWCDFPDLEDGKEIICKLTNIEWTQDIKVQEIPPYCTTYYQSNSGTH